MNVIGVGTDIIQCYRIEGMIEKHQETFLNRVYTTKEIEYCQARKAYVQHFAGRWAAKEAILKAIGTGWAKGIQWTDIEVINDGGGKPSVILGGEAAVICHSIGIAEVLISISHCEEFATAFATAVGAPIANEQPKVDQLKVDQLKVDQLKVDSEKKVMACQLASRSG